jgi:hypothetical protein
VQAFVVGVSNTELCSNVKAKMVASCVCVCVCVKYSLLLRAAVPTYLILPDSVILIILEKQ